MKFRALIAVLWKYLAGETKIAPHRLEAMGVWANLGTVTWTLDLGHYDPTKGNEHQSPHAWRCEIRSPGHPQVVAHARDGADALLAAIAALKERERTG